MIKFRHIGAALSILAGLSLTTAEADISSYAAGYDYIQQGGFSFPYGDYFEIAIDEGATMVRVGSAIM